MHEAISGLLAVASDSICDAIQPTDVLDHWGPVGKELAELFRHKNGFYAFEAALLVRPLSNVHIPLGVLEWNAETLWKMAYHDSLGDALFFAEDVFGGQFCLREQTVCTFDPETGRFEVMSSSLEAWAHDLIADFQFRTGHPLAHAWQSKHGSLPFGMRLAPNIPFVCGGKYELENLDLMDDLKGMLFRASLANQIREMPDGTEIVFKSDDEASAT